MAKSRATKAKMRKCTPAEKNEISRVADNLMSQLHEENVDIAENAILCALCRVLIMHEENPTDARRRISAFLTHLMQCYANKVNKEVV